MTVWEAVSKGFRFRGNGDTILNIRTIQYGVPVIGERRI